jgi:16S rRNA (adenine1518-N6/adenine1519-N6)-dimethyltransferase
MEYSPKKINDMLVQNSFNFKKKFGQNFIIDENIINNIIEKSDIDKETLVIEVGPGAGALTYKLAEQAKEVVAFEIDKSLEPILKTNLKEFNNIQLIFEDFLKSDLNQILKEKKYEKIYLVANLPYYITTPILMKIIDSKIMIDKIVIMVQKEVGDRFKAKPGTKDYSSLSIFLQYYFDIKKIMDISRNVFMPKPNVDSIVILFESKKNILTLKNEPLFFKLIRDSFTQKRKTIKNNLKEYDLKIIEKVLNKYNYDLSIRAEQISLDIFVEIANELSN